ncbi:MAG: hypothetical protein F6K40_17465 [Okeania sp. SIO3I5]|uniref:hypothetical protein n=1 Tax=Okeania sp. SIO3I5 TaxID=2607805 RepID=UPI0013BC17F3|nr:hypothetical protein [Okeania sp. SIO3I5]NEQ37954.1 hypothetical protein [Okeania sp. SIO3I5]
MTETHNGVSINNNNSSKFTNNGNIIGVQNNNNPVQSNSLAETAAEIQEILKQLEESNPTNTIAGQTEVAKKAIEIVNSKPTLKERVVGLLKSVGTQALKEALNHPVANILVEAFKGWTKP